MVEGMKPIFITYKTSLKADKEVGGGGVAKRRGTNRTGTPRRRETHPLSRNPLPRIDHHRDLKAETLVKLS